MKRERYGLDTVIDDTVQEIAQGIDRLIDSGELMKIVSKTAVERAFNLTRDLHPEPRLGDRIEDALRQVGLQKQIEPVAQQRVMKNTTKWGSGESNG